MPREKFSKIDSRLFDTAGNEVIDPKAVEQSEEDRSEANDSAEVAQSKLDGLALVPAVEVKPAPNILDREPRASDIGVVKVTVLDPEAGKIVARVPVRKGEEPETVLAQAQAEAAKTRA